MILELSQGAQTALIAAAAAITTALVTAGASSYSARTRINEVRLTYSQKLHENYLATARAYTNSIYVPLAISFTRLSEAFVHFRDSLDPKTRATQADVLDEFRGECEAFLEAMRNLSDRGAEAFLTTALEEALISFTTFLRQSLKTTEVRRRAVVEMDLPLLSSLAPPIRREMVGLPADETAAEYADAEVTVFGMKMKATSRREKLVAAPLLSEAFEQRMVADLTQLKAFIKEVTLGAHSGPPV